MGIKKQIINNIIDIYPNFNCDEINLSINIDGIPLFESVKSSLWPILLCLNIEPYTIFPVTFTYGIGNSTKPSNDDFMREMVDELKDIMHNGILINNLIIKITIKAIICDAPARSMIKHVIGHSGYSSCDRCDVHGEKKTIEFYFWKKGKEEQMILSEGKLMMPIIEAILYYWN